MNFWLGKPRAYARGYYMSPLRGWIAANEDSAHLGVRRLFGAFVRTAKNKAGTSPRTPNWGRYRIELLLTPPIGLAA